MFPSLVDEINGVLGEGPESLKTRKDKAISPLIMIPLCSSEPIYFRMHDDKSEGGDLVENHHMMHALLMILLCARCNEND